MSAAFWSMALAAAVCLLFALTLAPALLEQHLRRDASPLRVVREHDGNIAHFARGFERFVETRFGAALSALRAGETREEVLDVGPGCILLGPHAEFPLKPREKIALAVGRLVMGAGVVRLPEHISFEADIFAGGDFYGGALAAYRAVLARGSADLAEDSVVLRWIHAGDCLAAGARSQLFGRASADRRIELAGDVVFERLHAPEIVFGPSSGNVPPEACWRAARAWHPPDGAENSGGRWRVGGNVEVPPASLCDQAIVATGGMRVGDGGWLQSSIKSNGPMVLGKGCRVDGAVVSTGRLEIGPGCRVKGPVVSEGEVLLRAGSELGSLEMPTTISAPCILVETGVRIFGSAWARERGKVEKCA